MAVLTRARQSSLEGSHVTRDHTERAAERALDRSPRDAFVHLRQVPAGYHLLQAGSTAGVLRLRVFLARDLLARDLLAHDLLARDLLAQSLLARAHTGCPARPPGVRLYAAGSRRGMANRLARRLWQLSFRRPVLPEACRQLPSRQGHVGYIHARPHAFSDMGVGGLIWNRDWYTSRRIEAPGHSGDRRPGCRQV